MTKGTPQAAMLVGLLQDEHAALLRADFAALDRIATRKNDCLGALQLQTLHPETLGRLRQMSLRNQSLIDAAQDGLRIALATLAALAVPRMATTYGPDGQRQSLRNTQQTLSQKF